MHISEKYRNWFIGVSLAILANIISNLGLNFQKKAHSRREANKQATLTDKAAPSYQHPNSVSKKKSISHEKSNSDNRNHCKIDGYKRSASSVATKDREPTHTPVAHKKKKQQSYVCDGVWLLGLFGQIVGALLDFAALGYAPQSVVAPLGSLTLVVNVLLSVPMHNERPSLRTMLGTLCIIMGAVTTVASSPREDSITTVSAVFDLYEHTSFLVYATITGGFISIGWCLTQYFVYLSRNKQARYTLKYYKQHRFVIAAISGTMGAQNVLFAKSVSVLVVKSIENGGRVLFGYWETYVLLAGLFSTIYFQLRWLNSGLKRFSALYVAPIFQAFWITVSVMGGLIVYKEYDNMQLWQRIVFPIGVIITICGVFYLTTQAKVGQKYRKITEEEDEEEEADTAEEEEEVIINDDIDDDNIEDPILLSHDDDEDEEEQNEAAALEEDGDIYDINSIKLRAIEHKEEPQPPPHGSLMGLIKNLGELGDASIVTGSSLGKLLLDPNALYKDINFGANDEDTHYKAILSPSATPNLSCEEEEECDMMDDDDSEKEILKKKKRRIAKKRSVSFSHFSDNNADILNERRKRNNKLHKRRARRRAKTRARSHSPSPLRIEDMAPHEVVWEKLTSIFVERNDATDTQQHTHSGYTSFNHDDKMPAPLPPSASNQTQIN